MTPSKITSKNEEMHSSQWIYLECHLEPDLIIFELSWPFQNQPRNPHSVTSTLKKKKKKLPPKNPSQATKKNVSL